MRKLVSCPTCVSVLFFAVLFSLPGAAFAYGDGVTDADLERIEAQVDVEIVAGDVSSKGGLNAMHGLVRTHAIGGDFTGLPNQTAIDGTEFGYSVAVSGDWLAVGAPGTIWTHGTFGTDSHGAVFVFQRSGGAWVQRQRIQYPTGYDGARCGHALAMNATHLVFGCPDSAPSPGGPAAGHVVIFAFDGDTQRFVFLERYYSDLPGHCGASIALTRNYMASGCPTALEDERGRVSVRRRNPQNNRFTVFEGNRFVTSNPGAAFGTAIALYEPSQFDQNLLNVRLAIGAPSTIYDGSNWPRGMVYVYHRAINTDTWDLNTRLRPVPAGQAGAELAGFGRALAMNRQQLVVGAPNNRYGSITTLPGPGSAHRYSLAPLTGWQAQETGGGINLPAGPHSGMRFGGALALGWSGITLVGAPGTDGTMSGGGSATGVGMLELRRTASEDWSVFNYFGDLRPGPLNVAVRTNGHFGHALDADTVNRRVVVGNPRSGTSFTSHPRGSVWIYEYDLLFANGFQSAP